MTSFARLSGPLGLAFCVSLLLHAPSASAAKPNPAQALNQRMADAEARYRASLARQDGASEREAAMAEMEAVVAACARQRGCSVNDMLATYNRLLKLGADSGDDEGDLVDDTASGDVPRGAEAAALLGEDGQRFVKMVQFNPAVQAGIRRWLTDMRPSLMDSYENYRYLQAQMSPAFKRHGLPEALLFGILAKESNGKVHAGSRAGAVGPMQFMPATGRRYGLGDDGSGFDTRYDPRAAADAAATYLQERLGELGNSIELSLAAYNGGEGRALRVYQGSGGRGFWDYDIYNQFPAETRDYVPMVIAAAWLYLHPREYGISFPRVNASATQLRLAQPSSLYELTICLGNGGSRDGYLRTLRNLNPRYEPDRYLPAGTVLATSGRINANYQRYCQQGPRAALAKQLVDSRVESAIVRVGPFVPTQPPVSSFTPPAGSVPTTVATGQPQPATTAPAGAARFHLVRPGDNLIAIARTYQCDVGTLARANALQAPGYNVRLGQRLKLEGCKAQ